MRPTLRVASVLAVGLLLAGCTQTVSGHGTGGGAGGGTDFPSGSSGSGSSGSGPSGSGSSGPPGSSGPSGSTSAPPPAANLACPKVVDPATHLSYDCIVGGMAKGQSEVWETKFEKDVDVDWTMDEGSTPAPARIGTNVGAAANALTTAMLAAQNYGPSPGVKKEKDVATTVNGKPAHLVQTLMTVNAGYRKQRHLKVAQERLYVVAIRVSSKAVSAWYVSVPDVQKALWARVPSLISSIKVV
jgi:hypothetical protein